MNVTVPPLGETPVNLIPTAGFVERSGSVYVPVGEPDLWVESDPDLCNADDGFPLFAGGTPLSVDMGGGEELYAVSQTEVASEVRVLVLGREE